jgi:hypothetical protein
LVRFAAQVRKQQAADTHREVLGPAGDFDQRRHMTAGARMQAAVCPRAIAASAGMVAALAGKAYGREAKVISD